MDRLLAIFSLSDYEALAFFLFVWAGYTLLTDASFLRPRSIAAAMERQRQRWFEEAFRRDLRILDTGILQILMSGMNMFASTSIIVIGGLFAAMGYNEALAGALARMPFATPSSPEQLMVKLAVLLAIFIYAFFKFAWAIRLSHYCAILLGGFGFALAEPSEADQQRVAAAARLNTLCGLHFNRGIRAIFFGLATVGWFIGPVFYVASTLFILAILARREFGSAAAAAVKSL
ncbi:DUF599 domain-containing protein [Gimibacter soli]|uniref:DUF599 domain-containing protein n=1 Tax=Gimibacter soli TaxID=3024400 RepID=A0AAE9XTN7_9PROT|nr:DUF599 domain-containing protein [Gimibacter soli]WCL53163.1 DUF599 domain-containing protein [Gimibacter soli]